MAKELLNIKIQTLPNGYSLTVGDNKYMYHSTEELLEGFMYHVGLEEIGYINIESMKDFLTAAVVYRADDKDITKKMKKLSDENQRLTSLYENTKAQLDYTRKMIKKCKKGDIDDDFDDDDE